MCLDEFRCSKIFVRHATNVFFLAFLRARLALMGRPSKHVTCGLSEARRSVSWPRESSFVCAAW